MLREQFEAWYAEHPLYTSLERDGDGYKAIGADVSWQAYQAGHAASGREELLEALDGVMNSIEAYETIENPKPESNWDEYDTVMIPRWRAASAAIKKARAE